MSVCAHTFVLHWYVTFNPDLFVVRSHFWLRVVMFPRELYPYNCCEWGSNCRVFPSDRLGSPLPWTCCQQITSLALLVERLLCQTGGQNMLLYVAPAVWGVDCTQTGDQMLAEGKNPERCSGRESHLLLPEIKRRMRRRVEEIMWKKYRF